MSITYQLTRRDIFYASLLSLFQQPVFIGFFILMFIFVTYRNLSLISPEDNILVSVIVFCIFQILPIFFVGGVLVIYVFLSTLSGRNRTLLSKQTISISESIIVCESEFSKSELKWTALQRIVRTRNYAFLYLSELGAMLIPKRAFASSTEWENFIRYCLEKSKAK